RACGRLGRRANVKTRTRKANPHKPACWWNGGATSSRPRRPILGQISRQVDVVDGSAAVAGGVSADCERGGTMPNPMGWIFAATAILVLPVDAATCPEPITEASRLVLVATRTMDTELATMQLFTRQRPNRPWKRVSAAEPAVVGKAGLGWGYPFLHFKEGEEPEKVEGDKRTRQVSSVSVRASVLRLQGGPATLNSRPG